MRRLAGVGVAVLCVLAGIPDVASGAARGAALDVPTSTGGGVRYPDVGYSVAANAFLAVTGKGKVQGAWIAPNGGLLGSTFDLTTAVAYQQAPRVACGEAGVCLVVWHQGDNGTAPTARVLSYSGGFLSAPITLGSVGSNWEMGAGVAYSPASDEFLVTWMGDYPSANNIYIARLNLSGQLLGTAALTTGSGYEREPSVAYNSASDEFIVSYAGVAQINGVETAYAAAQRVKGGAALGSPMILDTANAVYISNAEYNPANGSVLIGWSRGTSLTYGRAVNADGSLGSVSTIASIGAYDALDFAYNPVSKSFLLVSHGSTVEDVAVEISSSLAPSSAFTLTQSGGTGNFNPRVAASTAAPLWLAVTSRSFATLVGQFATSTADAGACTTDCGGSSPPPSSGTPVVTSLSANVAFPVPVGTPVTWTASVSGGTTVEYRFVLYNQNTNTWSEIRSYSTSNSVTWTPSAAATYNVQVWARNVGSTAEYESWKSSGFFSITGSTVSTPSVTSLSANVTFPVPVGTAVTWTAAVTGGTTVEYRFVLFNQATNAWSEIRGYSTSPSVVWTPSAAGTYNVQVWVRNVGSTAAWESWKSSGYFNVAPSTATPTVLALTANVSFPTPAGTAITWAAASSGGTNVQYRFVLYSQSSNAWTELRAWSGNAAAQWTPSSPGTYAVQVWARNGGSTAAYESWKGSGYFTIGPATTYPVLVSVAPSDGLPSSAGRAITWYATAVGGNNPEYRFVLFNQGTGVWSELKPYGATNSVSWTPSAAGTYAVQAWVRNQGSSAAWESWLGSGYFTIVPTVVNPPTVTALTPSVSLPAPVGTAVTFTASISGGSNVEYRFVLYNVTTNQWSELRPWGPGASATWTPAAAGFYAVQVWARNVGSGTAYDSWRGYGFFQIY